MAARRTTSLTMRFGAPALDADALAAHWRVRVSSDGKSLELFNASGMTIILR